MARSFASLCDVLGGEEGQGAGEEEEEGEGMEHLTWEHMDKMDAKRESVEALLQAKVVPLLSLITP